MTQLGFKNVLVNRVKTRRNKNVVSLFIPFIIIKINFDVVFGLLSEQTTPIYKMPPYLKLFLNISDRRIFLHHHNRGVVAPIEHV